MPPGMNEWLFGQFFKSVANSGSVSMEAQRLCAVA